MNILLLTPSLPYPMHQGGALRNFGILKGLADAGERVTLLSFGDPHAVAADSPLKQLCDEVIVIPPPSRSKVDRLRDLLLTTQPDIARRLESGAFRAALRSVLNKKRFDIVQAEGLEMAIYLHEIRTLQPTAKLIYDAHNAEFALQRAIASVEISSLRKVPGWAYSRLQTGRIERLERDICASANAVIAVSEEDAQSLRPFRQDGRVHVVPNAIFTADYGIESRTDSNLGAHALVFTGKMDYRPNVDAMLWFAAEIFPRVRQQISDARLYIVGQKPHSSLTALAGENIILTGWVDDVKPYLQAASVYVAPLRMGSGTRLKILEAMASGCAIVATRAAAAGLNDQVLQTIVLADTVEAFADAIISLLNDSEKCRRLGLGARDAVRAHYDWNALIPKLTAIHKGLLGG